MALSDGAISQNLDSLPQNRLHPPTFPFERALAWKASAIFSARSPQGAS
jgi:hypothetical protein